MRPTAADVVVILAAAVLIGGLAAHSWTPRGPAREFEVRVGGEIAGRYSLLEDRELAVAGTRGTSRITVEAGRVRFGESPCRNQVCVHRGWLSLGGDMAACVPNRVSIRLFGDPAAVDAVSQ